MDASARRREHQRGLLTSLSTARMVLARGGSCTINVRVSFDGDHECMQTLQEGLLALLAPHADRIEDIYIDDSWRICMLTVFRALGSNLPRLKRLRVVEYSCDYTPEDSHADIKAPFKAAKLQNLEMRVEEPCHPAFWADAFLPNVRQLRLVAYEIPSLAAALRQ